MSANLNSTANTAVPAGSGPSSSTRLDVLLDVQDLTLQFGGLKAVDNLSFEVGAGRLMGLIGPNGAGKTSVFNCITGFYHPTSGHIMFKGRDMAKVPAHRVAQLGIRRTFQNLRLFPQLSVVENVLTGAHVQAHGNLAAVVAGSGRFHASERALVRQADELMDFTAVSQYREEQAKNLPYGVQKRLEIARALIGDPALLLLDEPAAGLNTTERKELHRLILAIKERGVTIFMIEHDLDLVMSLCQEIVVIDYGKLVASGTPDEVQQNPAVIEAYLGKRGSHKRET